VQKRGPRSGECRFTVSAAGPAIKLVQKGKIRGQNLSKKQRVDSTNYKEARGGGEINHQRLPTRG